YYQYLNDRDFILLEQRGTQYAQPNLACPEWTAALQKANLSDLEALEEEVLYQTAALTCRDRLLAEGIDLNGYNTNESAADVEDLRKLLGLEQYNLLTLSYGTKIAQTLMRDYPSPIRSVVLDSPLPLEVSYDEESVQNLLETFDQIFVDCQVDSTCNASFPNLQERFYRFLGEITKNPIKLKIANPSTNQTTSFILRGRDVAAHFGDLHSSEMPRVPLMLDQVISGNYDLLQQALAESFAPPSPGNGLGARLSVWCAEEYPFSNQVRIKAETEKYPFIFGLSPATYSSSTCEAWGVSSLGEEENQPVKSNIPTLIINGSYDNITPVKWGKKMTKNLANSVQIIFPGWHHSPTTYWDNPCGMQVANAFFNDPRTKPVLECLEKIQEVEFVSH
ncbi:MAG: alpha/beta fold hydrolase, partial [Bacteroidota bacterium]